MKIEKEMMRGAGPTAVLQVLSHGEKYAYELVDSLAAKSNGMLAIGQSTLYPMLYNMEAKGLVASRVDKSGSRPRRYYRLTGKGKKRLASDRAQWTTLFEALAKLDVVSRPSTEGLS